MELLDLKILDGLDYASASADRNGAVVDMANAEWVIAIFKMATIATGAVTKVKWQQGAASNMSDAADLEGTGLTVADDDDNQIFAIALVKPRERYVRAVIDKDATNSTAETLTYIVGGNRTLPAFASITDDVTVEVSYSPAEGTA